jgi:hypothetical protein
MGGSKFEQQIKKQLREIKKKKKKPEDPNVQHQLDAIQ